MIRACVEMPFNLKKIIPQKNIISLVKTSLFKD